MVPTPTSPHTYDTTGDPRVSYRHTSTGTGQLVTVFRGFNANWGTGTYPYYEGLFVNFSSDNGKSGTWGTATAIEANDETSNTQPLVQTYRPYLITDNSPTSTYNNYTYVCWSDYSNYAGLTSTVKVGRIVPTGNTFASSAWSVTASPRADGTGDTVQACALSTDSIDGTVFLLWRRLYTSGTSEKFNLNISISTDGGSTWDTSVVQSGLLIPEIRFQYQDFPALTISNNTCYVAYTADGGSLSNPSDVFVTSTSWNTTSKTLGTWNTPLNIGADNVYGNFQFEIALCPDGEGGYYLDYYSQTTGLWPNDKVRAMIYHGSSSQCDLTHHALGVPMAAFTEAQSGDGMGIGDYIGIAWSSDKSMAHPVWTDINPSDNTDDIYTLGLAGKPLAGLTKFNNQRKAAGDASLIHFAVEQVDGSGNHMITYRRTNATFPDEIQTCQNDAGLPPHTGSPDVTFLNSTEVRRDPSIELYSMPAGIDAMHRYACLVWEAYPNVAATDPSQARKSIEWAIVKSTDGGETWSWILSGGNPFSWLLTKSVLANGQTSAAYDQRYVIDPATGIPYCQEASAYEITPVVAPLIDPTIPGSETCTGFQIFWGNGENYIESIAIDLTGAVRSSETAVSGTGYFWNHPSCVSAYFYDPSYSGYDSLITIAPTAGGFGMALLKNSTHLVYEVNNLVAAAQIEGTETQVNSAGLTWTIGNLTNYQWTPSCPAPINSNPTIFWDLSQPIVLKQTDSYCAYPSAYGMTGAYNPSISLDEFGRQRVTWRADGDCNGNSAVKYSAIVTLQGGGPAFTNIWCPGLGRYVTSPDATDEWCNAYENEVYWAWNTPDDGNELTSSPSITSTTLDHAVTSDSVEVVWQTDESAGGGSATSIRMADDRNDDGLFSNSGTELTQPGFGSTTGYTDGTDPNSVMGNASQKASGGFAYTTVSSDCRGADIVGFDSKNFNPYPSFKESSKTEKGLATFYSSSDQFAIQFSALDLNGEPYSGHFKPFSQHIGLATFSLHAGDQISFEIAPLMVKSGQHLTLMMQSENGEQKIIANFDTLQAERIQYFAQTLGNYTLWLDGTDPNAIVSTGYAAAPALRTVPNVEIGGPLAGDELSVSTNPFDNTTTIGVSLTEGSRVMLDVLNVLGNKMSGLEDGSLRAGAYSYQLDAHAWPDGIYFVRLQAGDQVLTKRIVKIQ